MLLVEDEPLISMSIEDVLLGLGCAKVFAATTVPAALGHLTAETIDVAVIDIVLRSETTFELARTLRDRGIPFVFTTGTRISGMPADFRDAHFLEKPHSDVALADALTRVLSAPVLQP